MLVPDPAMASGERVKVLDFGLAKLSEVREAAFVKTHSHAVLGTPLYMSPENIILQLSDGDFCRSGSWGLIGD